MPVEYDDWFTANIRDYLVLFFVFAACFSFSCGILRIAKTKLKRKKKIPKGFFTSAFSILGSSGINGIYKLQQSCDTSDSIWYRQESSGLEIHFYANDRQSLWAIENAAHERLAVLWSHHDSGGCWSPDQEKQWSFRRIYRVVPTIQYHWCSVQADGTMSEDKQIRLEVESDELRESLSSGMLSFFLCAFVLSTCLMWIFLIIFTIMVSVKDLNLHWTFSLWVTDAFVNVYWAVIIWMSFISLSFISPFAYLYYEAEGFGKKNEWMGRLIETSVVFTLFAVIMHIGFRLTLAILGIDSFRNLLFSFDNSVSFLAHSVPGLIVLFCCAHSGFYSLTVYCYNIQSPVLGREEKLDAIESIDECTCKLTSLQSKMKRTKSEKRRIEMKKQVDICSVELHKLKSILKNSEESFHGRSVLCLILTSLSIWLPWHLAVRIFCHSLDLLIPPHVWSFLSYYLFWLPQPRGPEFILGVLFGFPAAITSPKLNLLFDVCISLYVAFGATYGLHVFLHDQVNGYFKTLRDRAAIQFLLVNTTVLLCIASALPIGLWMIGGVTFNVMEFYPKAALFEGPPSLLYSILFLFIGVYQHGTNVKQKASTVCQIFIVNFQKLLSVGFYFGVGRGLRKSRSTSVSRQFGIMESETNSHSWHEKRLSSDAWGDLSTLEADLHQKSD